MTTTNRAERVVAFLSSLHGMDQLCTAPGQPTAAAIDLLTATVIEPCPDDPAGEFMRVEHPLGRISFVDTQKLVDALMVRHARAMAVIEPAAGGTAEQYRLIRQCFATKTGGKVDDR
jgi:hypothetical protein